jgi:predicted RNA-binding protein with TRAM domain
MSYGRGGSGYYRDFGGTNPVEVGKEYDVEVNEVSRQGDGVARVQGLVVFVKNGKVGDKAKVRVISTGSRFAIAEIVTK